MALAALVVCLAMPGQGAKPPLYAPGSEGVVYVIGDDCNPHPCGGYISPSGFREGMKIARANDSEGREKMLREGRRKDVACGSRVRVLEWFRGMDRGEADPGNDYCEVRILTGPLKGDSYFMLASIIRPEPHGFVGVEQPDIRVPAEYARALTALDKHIYNQIMRSAVAAVQRTSKMPKSSPERTQIIMKAALAAVPDFKTRYGCENSDIVYAIEDGSLCNWPIDLAGLDPPKPAANKAASALAVARALEKTNRKAAIDAYRKLVADYPGSAEAKAAGERLKALGEKP